MLPLPDRIWVARKDIPVPGGTSLHECIIHYESLLAEYRDNGYEITEYERAAHDA